MYHIKEDKRSHKSTELIYTALVECLKGKSFNQITVMDIYKHSSVSRATFYRHFDNISDILYWRCNHCFHQVLSNYCPDDKILKEDKYHFARYFLNYWHSHSDILEMLLAINRLDIIYDCHIHNMEIFLEKFPHPVALSAVEYHYFNGIRSGIMIGVLISWLKNKKQQSVDELFHIISAQLDFLQTSDFFI